MMIENTSLPRSGLLEQGAALDPQTARFFGVTLSLCFRQGLVPAQEQASELGR